MREIQNSIGYRFGSFEIDRRTGELRRDGVRIKLQEQPFKLLEILLENAPDLLTREELAKKIWDNDTFVNFDHSLNIAMYKIRTALGDTAENARFVETVPKRGYRFIAPVEPIPEPDTQWPASDILMPKLPAVRHSRKAWAFLGIFVIAIALVGIVLNRTNSSAPLNFAYTQLTNFPDAAFAPAISSDGRLLAFIRGNTDFPSMGQIYVKRLPDGDPIQLSEDPRPKYGIAFSPDGTQITYTVTNPERYGRDTVTVPATGGQPRPFMHNAAALSWLDDGHLLFSRFRSGVHMGIVRTADRFSDLREIYFPPHERQMVYFSWASPDRKWVLLSEKSRTGAWLPCRIVPMDGSSTGRTVGPQGECRWASWSPDGRLMYFSAVVNGASHIWRQRFPDGMPEQLTFGPAEEMDVAVEPDGRSLISSVGINESAVWFHDARGDRPVSAEGYASFPVLSADNKLVYYKLRQAGSPALNELWMTDIESGKSRPVVQGLSLDNRYDLSIDGKEVLFAAAASDGVVQVWVAPVDNSSPPVQLTSSGGDHPFFGPDGQIIFRYAEGNAHYIYRADRDGSAPVRIIPHSILNIKAVSPDRRWVIVHKPVDGTTPVEVVAVPLSGGEAIRICPGTCIVKWTSDKKQLFIRPLAQKSDTGKAAVFTLQPGEMPKLPPSGLETTALAASSKGGFVVDMSNFRQNELQLAVGPDAKILAYTRATARQNLFRIALR
jgi:DNA-binding winged helix-turn-helix (wHTH) protein/Tol biopolymer transport system component